MTSQDLQRFSSAVLALHACTSASDLGAALLAAQRALCDADSYAINLVGAADMDVYASDLEFTPSQMETFNAHLAEHPLMPVIEQGRLLGQSAGRWSEHVTLREFRNRPLYHDFFRHFSIQHQAASLVKVNDDLLIGVSFNRGGSDFRPEDVQMLELLLPHVRQLVQRLLAQREVEKSLALRELVLPKEACLIVDRRGRLLHVSEPARRLVRDYFAAAPADTLPTELTAWIRFRPDSEATLTRKLPGRRLHVKMSAATPWYFQPRDELLDRGEEPTEVRHIRLKEECEAPLEIVANKLGLTLREVEVLRWIAEGRRNHEIGLLLDISERTIDKHRENIFAKLHVKTRTAAAQLYYRACV